MQFYMIKMIIYYTAHYALFWRDYLGFELRQVLSV